MPLLLPWMVSWSKKVYFSFSPSGLFAPSDISLFLARAVFQATQDFYQQGVSMQKATTCSCSALTLELGLLTSSSNVLQAIYRLENAARNYRDATKEHDRLTALYEAKVASRSTR